MTALVSSSTQFSANSMGRFQSRDEDDDAESSFINDDYFDNSDRNSVPLIALQSRSWVTSCDLNSDLRVNDMTPSVFVTVETNQDHGNDSQREAVKDSVSSELTGSSFRADRRIETNGSTSSIEYETTDIMSTQTETVLTPNMSKVMQEESSLKKADVDVKDSDSKELKQLQINGNVDPDDCVMDPHLVNNTKNKRNRRRQRSQNSANKKWKSVNIEEMGFCFSSLARMASSSSVSNSNGDSPDGSPCSNEHDDSSALSNTINCDQQAFPLLVGEDDQTAGPSLANKDDQPTGPSLANKDDQTAGPSVAKTDDQPDGPSLANRDDQTAGPSLANKDDQPDGPSLANTDDQTAGPSLANKDDQTTDRSLVSEDDRSGENDDTDLDDEAFFAALGIDVNNGGDDFNDNDDILGWDGVHFHKKHQSFLSPKQNKSSPNTNLISSGTKAKVKNTNIVPRMSNREKSNKCVCNMSRSDVDTLFDFGCVSGRKVYLRADKHRKAMKAHKAIKSKHANPEDVLNNPGKKLLYMHHRLIKLLNIDTGYLDEYARRRGSPGPMPKSVDKTWIKGIRLNNQKQNGAFRGSPSCPRRNQPENLAHVLHETNSPGELELDLVSFLLSIQHRELTPEDYDMLLRLDDSVKAKTVSKNVLDTLKTETVPEGGDLDLLCAICMEPYQAGQVRKFLPCQHDFHPDCIDTWLNNSSQNCPLDGLPIEAS